ncbi:hypothetical protein HELRODRAFT_71201, partial [Helobdella robusta]|uniref:Serine/threonine-protein phosphatase PGAM5, mitochondrial n=1 Tax=Helobdella robusta TaxID=6412 RepID=T1G0H7_HELRO
KITATRNLFLIRHGQYKLAGQNDQEHVLTPLGIEQAKTAGRRLSTLSFKFSKMVVSTMTRAQQTAALINGELKLGKGEIENTDLLREGSPFPPEPSLHHWKPAARQFLEDGARIEKAFETFFHRAKPTQLKDSFEVYVCHANVIRYLVCRLALQLPAEAWLRMSLHHASITWIVIRPSGRVSIRFLGDTGFMAPNQLTLS